MTILCQSNVSATVFLKELVVSEQLCGSYLLLPLRATLACFREEKNK